VVESPEAFEEMKEYLLERYDGVEPVESFVDIDGEVVDCIREDVHPAARRWDGLATAPASSPPLAPEPDEPALPDPRSDEIVSPRPGSGRPLPDDTTPLRRTTLTSLCRFANLAAFSAKGYRAGPTAPAATELSAASFNKRYATGEQDIDCLGGSSKVNVWSPFVTPVFQSTFSQQWYSAKQDGTLLQSVECGWHIDIQRYGDAAPHLFVYTTRSTYADGASFWNQDGGVFRAVANPYVVPGTALVPSRTGGPQVEYKMGFYLTENAWWFYFDGHPIGCYPVSWFGSGPMASKAGRATFGGEAGSNLSAWPPMGSGRHASAGFGQAAYQRAATINPVGGGGVFAALADAGSVTGSCYSLELTNNSASFDWGTYLFFGGPGGTSC
jgi:hypothetical protein